MWKFKSFPSYSGFKEEITIRNGKYLELYSNESTMYQNAWNAVKTIFGEKLGNTVFMLAKTSSWNLISYASHFKDDRKKLE